MTARAPLRNLLAALSATALLFSLLACVGDAEEAQEACRDLLADHCAHLDSCGRLTTSRSECKRALEDAVDCDDVTGFATEYDECEQEADDLSCAETNLPSSCNEAFYE